MRRGTGFILTGMIIFALLACTPKYTASKSFDIEGGLLDTDTLVFELPPGIQGLASVDLLLSHNRDYNYENIYFKVRVKEGDSTVIENVLSIQLMDQFGVWMGKCGQTTCRTTSEILNNIVLGQDAQISILQYSREARLEGLKSLEIGLRSLTPVQ